MSSASTRASDTLLSTSLAVVNTFLLTNIAPTFAIGDLSRSTALAEVTEAAFVHTVEGGHGFSDEGISASLTFLGKALVGNGGNSIRISSISQRGDNTIGGSAIVKGLSGGHGHEDETESLKYFKP